MDYYNYHSELETIKRKVAKLEQENKNLRFELFQLTDTYKEAIDKIPIPILLLNKSGKIQFNNDSFVTLLDFHGREIVAANHELKGVDIADVVTPELYVHLEPFISRGATFIEKDIIIHEFTYNLSIHAIRKSEFGVIVFRLVTTKDEKNEEMIRRLDGVIETNFEMIQKIGSLMGEEVSKNTEILSSIIRMIK